MYMEKRNGNLLAALVFVTFFALLNIPCSDGRRSRNRRTDADEFDFGIQNLSSVHFSPARYCGKESLSRFMCLSGPEQHHSPNDDEKIRLARLGLGEKFLYLANDTSSNALRTKIIEIFPKLARTHFALWRAAGAGRSGQVLSHIDAEKPIPSVKEIKKVIKTATIYIHPLRNLLQDEEQNPVENVTGITCFCSECVNRRWQATWSSSIY